ncbi:phage major tail protein, TP901-1 family [Salipiger sp. H15]|uniref:Phage major tail protein, TP901-1 family n=1 Tax=Alloyangia sp. H15 TaxID=3029062 RepID=A0AAU8AQI4_9RHOB
MAKQKGRTLLIKLSNGQESPTFETLCALTTKTLTINNEEIDVTTADCTAPNGALWTEVLDGVKRVSLSGNGISKKDNAEARLASVAMSSPPVVDAEIIVPNFGTFAGSFFIQSGDFGGDQSGGVTFSLTAASTGVVTFTPEVAV